MDKSGIIRFKQEQRREHQGWGRNEVPLTNMWTKQKGSSENTAEGAIQETHNSLQQGSNKKAQVEYKRYNRGSLKQRTQQSLKGQHARLDIF